MGGIDGIRKIGEQTYMLNAVGMVDIFRNVIIVGMIEPAQSSVVKRFDVKIVRIQSGLNLLQEKSWNIWWVIRKMVQML